MNSTSNNTDEDSGAEGILGNIDNLIGRQVGLGTEGSDQHKMVVEDDPDKSD